ncbi:MAG: bifunctional sulfate adenylyltransferase/adenylylsulfate kinase [Candidatus Competibacter sp.]|nr:bifunctional sulfate adenylyltransferase/adenylylsulfate kinase [Candidatus Competibacter sp.]MDG4583027.1 bifunctional sulfate adenylyltransferase/adenylylsulfate kinase [Candidatus Competibacter sp.]
MRLIEPHGGALKELYLSAEDSAPLKAQAREYPCWDLTPRQLCDLELLLNGGFSPLDGFLNRADYDRVVEDMRLADGTLWPMPVTLDVSEEFAGQLGGGGWVALRDPEGVLIAVLEVGDVWRPDRRHEAQRVFGGADERHPGVFHLLHRTGPVYVGGRLYGIEPPTHYDFPQLRDSPRELRERFAKLGWQRVVAFQTRNPMHRAHQELTLRAVQQAEANLLIHPAVGLTKPGDIDHYSRVRCYEHLLNTYPEQTTALSLLNLAMRMAGPREALWHALIRQNHGCSHFIVGRDHGGPGKDSTGHDFYEPYAAQQLVTRHQDELGIRMLAFQEMVYVRERAQYVPADDLRADEAMSTLSGAEFRRRLQEGLEIPEWFSYPEVVAELRRTHPPRHRQGFTVFFTGLSGSGKSTIANALMVKLLELGGRAVTLLDGDIVRKHLSSELGFSREHRNINILRIGFVASEITKNGGIAICAPIAPYTVTRREVREMIAPLGGFIEVHVATPLETCEIRDRKGLYAKARSGILKEFTGISDPYEAPERPELSIDTRDCSPGEAAQRILLKLEGLGYIRGRS